MKKISIFKGVSGLNTVDPQHRIKGKSGGNVELGKAVDISIDASKRPNMRQGYEKIQSGSYHSLWGKGNDCFVCSGTTMYRVAEDGSLRSIATGLTAGERMDYTVAGDLIFYGNIYDHGYISGDESYPWQQGTYTGPPTSRSFEGPPYGQHLEFAFGRMFISVDRALYWSERFFLDQFDLEKNMASFASKILMLKAVDEGLFVSSENKTYFLSGKNPDKFDPVVVCEYHAVEWDVAEDLVEATEIGYKNPGLCCVWASREGVIVGFPGGGIQNKTKRQIVYPQNVTKGFGFLRGYNYIHGMR